MASPTQEPGNLPRTHVPRPRLLQKLSRASRHKLTVVCANAGYGKTTLVAEFVRSSGLPAEFYYLTPADRDTTRLAEGLEGCLRRLAPGRDSRSVKRAQARLTWAPSVAILSERLLRRVTRLGPIPSCWCWTTTTR